MLIIRIELDGELDKTAGKTVRAFVGKWITGPPSNPYTQPDGDPSNPIYVTDAWGEYEGRGGGPGVRGSVGRAVWMADSQRFEVLSLTGP